MKVSILYQTRYAYEQPVSFSPHLFRLFPRPASHLRIHACAFSTNPDAVVQHRRDLFDNPIASCFYPANGSLLQAQLALELEIEPVNAFDFLLAPHALELPLRYTPEELRVLAPCMDDAHLPPLPFWNRPLKARPTTEALVELNSAIHQHLEYERREEGDPLTPQQTLARGRGACRDFAVLLAADLRALGLAARLASGYLCEFEATQKRAESALHAWTEVYLPGAGWLGMDPTNGTLCSHHHITTAVGLTPRDVAPILGNYFSPHPVRSEMSSQLALHEIH